MNNFPSQLTALNQWITYRAKPSLTDPNKLTKTPHNPNPTPAKSTMGDFASVTDPATWSNIDRANQTDALLSPNQAPTQQNPYPPQFHGLGFVFVTGQPIFGIDLDYSRLPLAPLNYPITMPKALIAAGYSPLAPDPYAYQQDLLQKLLLTNTYYEISPSGTGHHFFATVSPELHASAEWQDPNTGWGLACVNHDYGVEAYRGERFFTMNPSHQSTQTPNHTPFLAELDALATMLFSQTTRRVKYDPTQANSALPPLTTLGRQLNLHDDTIIELASNVNKSFIQHFVQSLPFREATLRRQE